MATTLYRSLTRLALPLGAAYTLVRAARDGGGRYLRQRLGRGLPAGPFAVWVHCASVGEVQAAAPLVAALAPRVDDPVLVTTNTPTGAAVAARELPPVVTHAYLPLDAPGLVRRFLAAVRPRCALVLETELWPNLFAACGERGVPLAMVNGRLSPRTLNAPAWLQRAFTEALSAVSLGLARSESDAERFRALGLPADRLRAAGNLKFADGAAGEGAEGPAPLERSYVLAASTREGEEARVARAWAGLDAGGRVLVMAPRHPERREPVLRELNGAGWSVAVRSRGEAVTAATEIYLVDTLGELGPFMAHADVVFMGGSLVPRGGHNLLEPAARGRAVVTGAHTANFAEEAQALRDAGALVEVADEAGLRQALADLLADPGRRERLGAAAREVVAERAGVLAAYVTALTEWCPELDGKA
ncbi:3-deoxy-D-manno-octulosonic acid transferase [Thiohalorhabdus sp.]|uniref:3-deoxy-D-manno-octulosonic acid transferase n=1 Tax=Thiohalorhabdus sp. TaxID=3094134 RepID=UPI002FC2DAB5